MSTAPSWPPTRAEALRRLDAFLPRAGRAYAATRNDDLGPNDRSNVSTLSPYIRHRLLLEEEVVAATLAHHGARYAEAFLREVCWRTYWKGWLELRPGVWDDYRGAVARCLRDVELDPRLGDLWRGATSGRTGIDAFDAWARELVEIGYLHNHARMWFASIWVFTLGLPWALGADFFLRHLLDGDPASNTLSWRWVAGLQTRGKTYRATAENIARHTNGRFRPGDRLARFAEPIAGPAPPPPAPPAPRTRPGPGRTGLLLTEEDLHAESWPVGDAEVVALAALDPAADRSPLPLGRLPRRFTEGAIADGLARAARHFGVEADGTPLAGAEAVAGWASGRGVAQLVTAEAPVGPTAERLRSVARRSGRVGVRLVRVRRDWDDRLWPLATAGFFAFRDDLPRVWREFDLASPLSGP